MYEMVSSDGHAVTVARYLPYAQFGVRYLYSGSYGRAAPVYCVESVCAHIIRQTRGASYARYDYRILRRHAEFGHRLLEGVNYRMVAASGTPAYVLVAFKVFCCVLFVAHRLFLQ